MTGNALMGALEVFADLVADKVVERLRAGTLPDMLDQSASPLGRRRHINAVRRLVAAGESGAAHVGRRYLLSREQIAAELSRKPKKADGLADLRALLGGREAA